VSVFFLTERFLEDKVPATPAALALIEEIVEHGSVLFHQSEIAATAAAAGKLIARKMGRGRRFAGSPPIR
jgi:hypothetical protein